MYYVGVFGTTTSTFKLRANTKMFTGKHPCRGFRLLDHDFEDENADGECRGYFPNPGRLFYLSAGYCLSIHRDIQYTHTEDSRLTLFFTITAPGRFSTA